MDGAHDMGGVAWSGPVRPEPNEPVFHAEWERRAFAITHGDGHAGRLEYRYVAVCPRKSLAPGLPKQELLPDLVRRPRATIARARAGRIRRDCSRQAFASSKTSSEDPDA